VLALLNSETPTMPREQAAKRLHQSSHSAAASVRAWCTSCIVLVFAIVAAAPEIKSKGAQNIRFREYLLLSCIRSD
jgi:hypothetical protein